MTALFYQIINNISKITDQNYQEFKDKLLALLKEFQEHADVDNIKVLRNKLQMLLSDYFSNIKEHKAIRHHLKDLQKFVHELDEIIDEMEAWESSEVEEKIKLIDVVKKVESKFRNYSKIKKEKQKNFKQVAVKKKNIEYEKELIRLQLELVKLQRYISDTWKKVLIIFEWRDAAGKWGNIKRFTEYLNPRAAKVVALQKPTEVEQTQWYFQRYIKNLPNGGEIAFFDRSWYNRAGVEPVMGFVSKKNYEKFLHDVPKFESMLIDSGVDIIKLYYSVSKKEQAKRFNERKTNPLKQFKLSPIDQKSQQLWDKYTLAEYLNFSHTSTNKSPWVIIDSDDKKASRINSIKYVLSQFDYPDKLDKKYLKYDTKIIHSAEDRVMELRWEIGKNADLFWEK